MENNIFEKTSLDTLLIDSLNKLNVKLQRSNEILEQIFLLQNSINSPTRLISGSKTVATAGAAERLTTASAPCLWVVCMAPMGNTGIVAVGDGSVKAATDTSGIGIILTPLGMTPKIEVDDLNKIWIDSTVNSEGVTYVYAFKDSISSIPLIR